MDDDLLARGVLERFEHGDAVVENVDTAPAHRLLTLLTHGAPLLAPLPSHRPRRRASVSHAEPPAEA